MATEIWDFLKCWSCDFTDLPTTTGKVSKKKSSNLSVDLKKSPTVTGSASKKKMTGTFTGTSPGRTIGCRDLKILDDKCSQRF